MGGTVVTIGSTTVTLYSNMVMFRCTLATGEGNFPWREFAVFNASAAGVMLNHGIQYLGSKTSGTYQFYVIVTLSQRRRYA